MRWWHSCAAAMHVDVPTHSLILGLAKGVDLNFIDLDANGRKSQYEHEFTRYKATFVVVVGVVLPEIPSSFARACLSLSSSWASGSPSHIRLASPKYLSQQTLASSESTTYPDLLSHPTPLPLPSPLTPRHSSKTNSPHAVVPSHHHLRRVHCHPRTRRY